jgi:hypothetical protein
MSTENSSPIEHQNVPQEHRGLHDFLYSSADEHGGIAANTAVSTITADELVDLEAWCAEAQEAKIAGVYAVFDIDRQVQYISYSRNVALSLRSHLNQFGANTCAFTRVQPFKFPKREEMEQLRDAWIAELVSPPPGNSDTSGSWTGTIRDAATQVMSPAERAAYEEKKLKLRRAMADGTLHQEIPAATSEVERRQNLESAIQNDNWSAVIKEQTQETQA